MTIKAVVISLLILLTISTHAFADQFSSWGSINYTDSEGFRLESSFKDSFPVGRLNIYISLGINQSSKREQIWNNKLTPALGIEYRLPFTLFKGAEWQYYTIGGKGQVRFYTDIDDPAPEIIPYFNWGFGGRFNKYLPYSSWGNLKYTDINGLYLETAFKQDLQLNRIVPYVDLGLTQSSIREHIWDNKVTVRVGIEYILPLKLFSGWEDYRTGVKVGYDFSTDHKLNEFTFTFYFINWSFGGMSLIERTF